MANDTPVTPTKVYAGSMQKVADAWSMRIRGAGWDEIARAVGYANPQNAMRAVRNYAGTLPEPQMPELRSLWRERLEFLWPVAVRDVESGKPGAMRAAVAVAQRAAQLDGLDAAQRLEVSADTRELHEIVSAILLAHGAPRALEADIFDADVVDD